MLTFDYQTISLLFEIHMTEYCVVLQENKQYITTTTTTTFLERILQINLNLNDTSGFPTII